jgi:hypothetical protein
MAIIYGPQTGHADLQDSAGNDTIVAAGGYNTITSLYGDDTISGGSIGYNTILAGTQYDGAQRDVAIRLNGLGNSVTGGDADFTIYNSSGGNTINLGDGNDTLALGGLYNAISVGLGQDVITAGGGYDAVTVQGVAFFANTTVPPEVTVQFAGFGNVFENGTFNGDAEGDPMDVVSNITGGAGNGYFNMWGGGSVATAGVDNTVVAGDGNYTIAAGSGDDTVVLENFYGENNTVNVILAGSGNNVSGEAAHLAISGGAGGNTIDVQGGGNVLAAQVNVTLAGSGNVVTMQDAAGYIDLGGDGSIVNLGQGTNLSVLVGGSGDFIGLGDSSKASINDRSDGLQIDVTGGVAATIYNFGVDRGAVLTVDLAPGLGNPFQNAEQIVAALHETARGAALSFGNGADSILFAGVNVSQLTVGNFAV